MLPGETIASGAPVRCECGELFMLRVLHSGAGYYIGTACENEQCEHAGEPYSRESESYWRTFEEARRSLETDSWVRRW